MHNKSLSSVLQAIELMKGVAIKDWKERGNVIGGRQLYPLSQHALYHEVMIFQDGLERKIPESWKIYLKDTENTEYKEYLRLKAKFDG